MMQENIDIQAVTPSTIYQGGNLTAITSESLTGNVIAITQLINSHNQIVKEVETKNDTITLLTSQLEYLRTAPFVSIIAAIVNVVGEILVGIGVNLLTNDKPQVHIGGGLIICGSILLIVASVATIIHPKVRQWFNHQRIER